MAMNRAQFRKELQQGLNAVFGMEYTRYPEEWREGFSVEKSIKAYEEDVLLVGLGAAPVKHEGQSLDYDEGYESYVARYQHQTIALAFAITEEAEEDGLYGSLGQKFSRALARSLQHTKEVIGANIFNNGQSNLFVGGDGVSLFNVGHPLGGGGVLSNTLSTPTDLSEAAIEQLVIQLSQWTDDRGIPIQTQIDKLLIPTALQFVAQRILNSPYQSDTGDNNINAMYKQGTIQKGFAVNHRFTDPANWYLTTDCQDGLKHFVRKAVSRGLEGDFETGNLRYKARERYSFGWSDWRGAASGGN